MPAPIAVVIEDEPQIRRFVRAALESEGWQVHEADTLQRGLTEAGTRKPDLLILDLGLPDGNGIDLIRDVRGWSGVPIVVLSARSPDGHLKLTHLWPPKLLQARTGGLSVLLAFSQRLLGKRSASGRRRASGSGGQATDPARGRPQACPVGAGGLSTAGARAEVSLV